jgi:hypothetical protein
MVNPSPPETLRSDSREEASSMARVEVDGGGARTRWRNPVIRFEGHSRGPAEVVYDLLADLASHLDWAGERQLETTRLLTLEAPTGPASVGTEFSSTGTDGKIARWSDRSVVTEAMRPEVFEFVTEGRREAKPGGDPWLCTAVHRYEIAPESGGCRVTYTEDLTRFTGAPFIFTAPVLSRVVFRISAKYMRRGFDGLLAAADERSNVR